METKKITYEDIVKANQLIVTTDVKGKAYAEVNQRIKAFRSVYPTGSIVTEIISLADGIVTMKATVSDGFGLVLGTGLAQEKESSSYINKTSYIENCETSAVGRALGMCGFGIDTSVASYEEVANAIENQKKVEKPDKLHIDALLATAAQKGVTEAQLLKKYNLKNLLDMDYTQYNAAAAGLNKMPDKEAQ